MNSSRDFSTTEKVEACAEFVKNVGCNKQTRLLGALNCKQKSYAFVSFFLDSHQTMNLGIL